MDTGDIAILVGIGFANLTILIALFALMWQTRSASRADANEQRAELRELRTAIIEQGERLNERISDEMREQRAEMREQRAEMREQGERLSQRISDSEREQARLEGVNSVLLRHTHTHEIAAD